MPKKNINYQNTIIYKIEHTDKPEIFSIGHTTDFTTRKNLLKKLSTTVPKGTYKHLIQLFQDNGDWDAFKMIEIKKFPCSDKNEADTEVWKLTVELKQENLRLRCLADEKRILQGFTPQLTSVNKPCEMFTCKCGSVLKPDGRNKHAGSVKHMNYEKQMSKT